MKPITSTCLAIAAIFAAAVPSSAQLAQSPINIVNEAIIKTTLPKLSFAYSEKANLTFKNTGAPDVEAQIKMLCADYRHVTKTWIARPESLRNAVEAREGRKAA